MSALFTLAGEQSAQPADDGVYYRLPAVADGGGGGKALHDRGRSGLWALLMILAWMLLAGNWAIVAAGLAVGRRALCADADYRHDADRPGGVCRHPGRE